VTRSPDRKTPRIVAVGARATTALAICPGEDVSHHCGRQLSWPGHQTRRHRIRSGEEVAECYRAILISDAAGFVRWERAPPRIRRLAPAPTEPSALRTCTASEPRPSQPHLDVVIHSRKDGDRGLSPNPLTKSCASTV
jgi:hypothetical protein